MGVWAWHYRLVPGETITAGLTGDGVSQLALLLIHRRDVGADLLYLGAQCLYASFLSCAPEMHGLECEALQLALQLRASARLYEQACKLLEQERLHALQNRTHISAAPKAARLCRLRGRRAGAGDVPAACKDSKSSSSWSRGYCTDDDNASAKLSRGVIDVLSRRSRGRRAPRRGKTASACAAVECVQWTDSALPCVRAQLDSVSAWSRCVLAMSLPAFGHRLQLASQSQTPLQLAKHAKTPPRQLGPSHTYSVSNQGCCRSR